MRIGLYNRDRNINATRKVGGFHQFIRAFIKICSTNKWEIVDLDECPDEKVDIVFFTALGIGFENKDSDAQRVIAARMDYLRRNKRARKDKAKVVLLLHGVKEHIFYKRSYEQLKDFEFDLIIHPFNSKETVKKIKHHYKCIESVQIHLPFEFMPTSMHSFSQKADKIIISPNRIDALKRTLLVLMIARYFEKNGGATIRIYGEESGVYWYRAIKCSRLYAKKYFKGAYTDYKSIYDGAQFGIDLSVHKDSSWKDPWFDYGKIQYTDLEMIDQLVIPIAFSRFLGEIGYKLNFIKLPDPIVDGNRLVFDIDSIIDIIKNAEYSRADAIANKEEAIRHHSIDVIARKYKRAFSSLVGRK